MATNRGGTVARCCFCPATGHAHAMSLGNARGKRWLVAAYSAERAPPVPALLPSEMLTPPEDEGVWYEPEPVPSRMPPVLSCPSSVPSLAPMMPSPVSSSQPLPPPQQQQPTRSQRGPRELRDYFSRTFDGGEPQPLGRTRA